MLMCLAMTSGSHQRQSLQQHFLASPPKLRESPRSALFLDFDGTLVDIAAAPDAIRPDPALPKLLTAVAERLEGRLAVVSGRALADLDRWLGGIDVALSGSHGSEWRLSAGSETEALARPVPLAVEAQLRRLAEAQAGLLVESKPFGVAIHYRQRPEAEETVVEAARAVCADHGLSLKRGKMVVELVAPGVHKGLAVEKFMALPSFSGAVPYFLGDDITDEDAFAAARDLGGGGILVGPTRETAALWRLAGVEDVFDWLEAILA